ncbi:hypothetical protein IFO70_27670 [Phormidium tenue FACHB-886]|nr:hypothetical protein [Phormidium tenue FACHB-886]
MTQLHPLFGIYQSFLRAYATRLHPELELLWQLNDDLQGTSLLPLSAIVTKLAVCNEAIETDATRVLSMPDFQLFWQTCLRNYRPRQAGAPAVKPLSVHPDPDYWALQELGGLLEIIEFELTPRRSVLENGKACVIYSYAMAVRLDEFTADLEGIEMGRLYESPFQFVAQDFKSQQEAIAQQMKTQFAPQGDIPLQVVEEASCILCYVTLALALESRIETFWQQQNTHPESLFSTIDETGA